MMLFNMDLLDNTTRVSLEIFYKYCGKHIILLSISTCKFKPTMHVKSSSQQIKITIWGCMEVYERFYRTYHDQISVGGSEYPLRYMVLRNSSRLRLNECKVFHFYAIKY